LAVLAVKTAAETVTAAFMAAAGAGAVLCLVAVAVVDFAGHS
jgi:hypothetical protein